MLEFIEILIYRIFNKPHFKVLLSTASLVSKINDVHYVYQWIVILYNISWYNYTYMKPFYEIYVHI